MSENLYADFEARFPADRAAPALVLADGTTWSYGDLERETGRIAGLLRDLGVAPGDRVAVQVEKSPQALFAYLACLKAGAVYLPLNTAYKGGEIAYFLGDAEPTVFVCDPARQGELQPVADKAGVRHVLTLDSDGAGTLAERAATFSSECETVQRDGDDLAAICYTSGTTGRSKGAMLSHRNLSSNALTLHEVWGFQPGDVLLHALPLFHVHGLFVASNTALLNGSKMIFLPRFDAEEVIRLLPGATVMMGVPTFYVRLLEHPEFTPEACRHTRLFISGSAPLRAEDSDAFHARTGFRILERYGMTEAGMITSNPLDGERRPGTVGFPLPGVEVRVSDSEGRVLPRGEVGVLEIKGPNLFQGYWRMPEKTAEEFRPDGYFITGDNAFVDADGYVHIVGRAKDLIISGGYNVYPKEVEIVIDGLDSVKESAVFGVPHPDFGEAVAAAVVPEPGANPDEAAIIQAVKAELANYKVPKRVFLVDSLPRNTMGKVQKNELRSAHETTFTGKG